jgi:hypothetical protein
MKKYGYHQATSRCKSISANSLVVVSIRMSVAPIGGSVGTDSREIFETVSRVGFNRLGTLLPIDRANFAMFILGNEFYHNCINKTE